MALHLNLVYLLWQQVQFCHEINHSSFNFMFNMNFSHPSIPLESQSEFLRKHCEQCSLSTRIGYECNLQKLRVKGQLAFPLNSDLTSQEIFEILGRKIFLVQKQRYSLIFLNKFLLLMRNLQGNAKIPCYTSLVQLGSEAFIDNAI